jgi:hypothetical protein
MSDFAMNLTKNKKSKISKKESQSLADKSLERTLKSNIEIKTKIGCELHKRIVKAENDALLRDKLREVWE